MLKAQRVSATTRLVGLLGHPVAHSLSPHIHNHAFCELGLPFVYVPLDVTPEKLGDAVNALRTLGFAGANVTIPHKQAVMTLCDEVSELSRRTGTANTLYFKENRLCATTTDPEGFYRALEWMGHDPHGGRILILGNGGVARTLGFSLVIDRIPNTLAFAGRNAARVEHLADAVRAAASCDVTAAAFGTPAFDTLLRECSLLVNCTSAGMHPHADESPIAAGQIQRTTTVFDTIYNPANTKLLSLARAAGCPVQNGLRMLLYQGLASFSLWTGRTVPETLFDFDELQSMVSG